MEYYLLFAIGLILIAFEVFIYSFVVIWFGLGFFIVGFFSLFFSFNELNYQLITICIISILLLFLFRNSLKKRFFRASKNIPDNFLNSSGVGEFKQGKIFYKKINVDGKMNTSILIYDEHESFFYTILDKAITKPFRDEYGTLVQPSNTIDSIANKYLNNWTIDRLGNTDKAILEMSIYELLYTETPDIVCINEGIELAKLYSDDSVRKMINAVLDNVYHNKEQ